MATYNKDFRVKNALIIGSGSANEQTFPSTRGSEGQVLTTNSSGSLYWSTVSSGGEGTSYIDGGTATSTYTASQTLDGGSANG